jgi:hypothetical protein
MIEVIMKWSLVVIATGEVLVQYVEKPDKLGGPWQWGLEDGTYEWQEVPEEEA